MATVTRNFNNTHIDQAQEANTNASVETSETYSKEQQTAKSNSEYVAIAKNEEGKQEVYNQVNPANTEEELVTETKTADNMKDAPAGATRGNLADNDATATMFAHPLISAGIVVGVVATAVISIVAGVKVSHRAKRIAEMETKINANSSNYSAILKYNAAIDEYNNADDKNKQKLAKKVKSLRKDIEKGLLSDTQRRRLIIGHANLLKRAASDMYHKNTPADKYRKESFKAHQKAIKLAAEAEGKKIKGKFDAANKKSKAAANALSKVDLGSAPTGLYFPEANQININGKSTPLYIHRCITNYPELNNKFNEVHNQYPISEPTNYICRITLYKDEDRTELECEFNNQNGYAVSKALILKKAEKLAKAEKYKEACIEEFISTKKETKTKSEYINLTSEKEKFNSLIEKSDVVIKKFDEKVKNQTSLSI